MNFAEFKTKVKAVVFPIGEAENLVEIHNTFIVEALADIQQLVPSFRERNTDVIAFKDTRYNCGTTVTAAPDGIIKRIYSVGADFCCKTNYRKSTLAQIRTLEAYNNITLPPTAIKLPTQPTDKPTLPLGDLYPDASADSPYGRSTTGYWAVEGCRLYIWPYLQSNEDLVIEWSGVKTTYVDSDLIYDDTVVIAVRAALQRDIARNIESNDADALKFDAIYRDKLGDLHHWHRQKTEGSYAEEDRMPILVNGCVAVENKTPPTAASEVEESTTFAVIGEYGLISTGSLAVASLVNSWNPKFIITTGGNNLTGVPTTTGYDLAVGRSFHNLIFPYNGAYGAGSIDFNRFWPCVGDSDYDSSPMLQAYRDYFTLPPANNELYYDWIEGPIHFFFIDSQSPDGTDVASVQAEWLRIKMAASNSPFKIVVMNCPPFTSSGNTSNLFIHNISAFSRYFWYGDVDDASLATRIGPLGSGAQQNISPANYIWVNATGIPPVGPGNSYVVPGGHNYNDEIEYNSNITFIGSGTFQNSCDSFRWPFKEWGATLVLDGLNRVYERVVVDNLPYITVGTGGADLGTFLDTPALGSLFRYNSDFGAVKGTVTCDSIKLEMINTSGDVVDSLVISK